MENISTGYKEDVKMVMDTAALVELREIKSMLSAEGKNVQLLGSTILNSTTPSFKMNANYYYSVKIWLNGTPSGNVNVYINPVTSQNSTNTVMYLNTTQTELKIKNIKLNEIYTDSTLGSSSVYVYYVAYEKAEGNPEIY